MRSPTIKFCLDHLQNLIQIFQMDGRALRFGLVKPGHPSKYFPICLFSGNTLKIAIDSAKKKIQTFLYSAILRGSYGPPLIKFAMVKWKFALHCDTLMFNLMFQFIFTKKLMLLFIIFIQAFRTLSSRTIFLRICFPFRGWSSYLWWSSTSLFVFGIL